MTTTRAKGPVPFFLDTFCFEETNPCGGRHVAVVRIGADIGLGAAAAAVASSSRGAISRKDMKRFAEAAARTGRLGCA